MTLAPRRTSASLRPGARAGKEPWAMGEIRFVWWNLQNFFDVTEGDIATEFEFTAANGWTPEVFQAKKRNLAAALPCGPTPRARPLFGIDDRDLEIAMLRHQMKRSSARDVVRPRFTSPDRAFLAAASRLPTRKRWASFLLHPDTITRGAPRTVVRAVQAAPAGLVVPPSIPGSRSWSFGWEGRTPGGLLADQGRAPQARDRRIGHGHCHGAPPGGLDRLPVTSVGLDAIGSRPTGCSPTSLDPMRGDSVEDLAMGPETGGIGINRRGRRRARSRPP